MIDGSYSINGGLSPLLSPMRQAGGQGSDVHRFSFDPQHQQQLRHDGRTTGNATSPVPDIATFVQDAARSAVSVQVSYAGEDRVVLAVQTRLADWTIEKQPQDFFELQTLIEKQMPFVDLRCRLRSKEAATSVHSLQLFLNELLANEITSNTTAVISFLDDRKTLQMQLHVLRLSDHVSDLRAMVATLQETVQIQQTRMHEQAQTIRDLTRRITQLEQADTASDASPTRDSVQSRTRPTIDTSDNNMPGFTLGLGPQFLGAHAGDQRPLSQTMLMMRPSESSGDEGSDQDDSHHLPGLLAEVMQVNTPPSPATGHFWDRKDSGGDHAWTRNPFTFQSEPGSDNPIPLRLIPSGNDLGPLELRVDELIGLIMPTQEHNLHREYIARFISRQVRKTLGGQTYGIGVHALRCYLPDDPITLSVFLCRGQESSWYIRLNEALCRVSGGVSQPTSANGTPTVAEEGDEGLITKLLTNVNFVNSGGEHRLQCVVDQLAVDIVPNCMRDLAWAGLFEELDRLVGKEHLLKRSCALLRAWWVYETTGYSGKSMLRYLSADALLVMMVCVFNQHHARIQQPLQALATFFHVFSVFPWQTHAVSIFGPVPLDPAARANEAGSTPTSASPPLVTQDLVAPFMQTLYPPTPTPTLSETHSGEVSPRMSNLAPFSDVMAAFNEDIDSPVDRSSIHGGDHPYASSTVSSGSTKPAVGTHCAIEDGFPRRSMNVVHPLVRDENLITDVVSKTKAARIQEVFLVGAKNVRSVLEHSAQSNHSERDSSIHRSTAHINTSVSLLENLFAHVFARFGQGWRPDNLDRGEWRDSFIGHERSTDYESNRLSYDDIPSEMQSDNDDPWEVNMAALWEQLRYCSLLLESQVTISALRTLSREILADRGPLPVGEIGKLLQETTSIATLSTILKDQFGGLKKFLEKFPTDFLISGDHPFNPHVYLRANLSDDDVTKILEGAPPAHITPKTRKRGNRRRKSGTGTTPTPASGSQDLSPPPAGATAPTATTTGPGAHGFSGSLPGPGVPYSAAPNPGLNKFVPVQHSAYPPGLSQPHPQYHQQHGARVPMMALPHHGVPQGTAQQHPMQSLSPPQQGHQHHLASRRPRPQIVTQGLIDPFGMGTNPHAREFVPRPKGSNM